jgi:uncharacterized protein
MEMVRKQVSAEPLDLGTRTIRFCISSESEDRDGDILVATGCDFSNFSKNPQFLGFHNYWDFPLGKPTKWWIDARQKKVYAEVYFPTIEELATDPEYASEKAKLVDTTYNMFKMGMLNAVSIGFRAKESSRNSESSTAWGQIISKWELLEFSAVPVPANPEAIAEARKSFEPAVMDLFETAVKGFKAEEKSGRRISAATQAVIEEAKGCHARIKTIHADVTKTMKELSKEHEVLDSIMERLEMGDSQEEGEEGEEEGDEEVIEIEE